MAFTHLFTHRSSLVSPIQLTACFGEVGETEGNVYGQGESMGNSGPTETRGQDQTGKKPGAIKQQHLLMGFHPLVIKLQSVTCLKRPLRHCQRVCLSMWLVFLSSLQDSLCPSFSQISIIIGCPKDHTDWDPQGQALSIDISATLDQLHPLLLFWTRALQPSKLDQSSPLHFSLSLHLVNSLLLSNALAASRCPTSLCLQYTS